VTKDFILAEIRRVAEARGNPPGKRDFFVQTGIKESDWSGKLWARWGDALREAGYEPNQKKQAHDEDHLMLALAGLVRELGRYPTRPESRLKRLHDGTFPTPTVFERRYGSRDETATHLKRYCEERDGYDDVVAACDAALASTVGSDDAAEDAETLTQGHVYMISCGQNRYKIGRTNSPLRRHREIKLDVPFSTDLVHSIATDDPVGIETYWHRRFEDKRVSGTQEFFKLDASDVRAFRRRKFM